MSEAVALPNINRATNYLKQRFGPQTSRTGGVARYLTSRQRRRIHKHVQKLKGKQV